MLAGLFDDTEQCDCKEADACAVDAVLPDSKAEDDVAGRKHEPDEPSDGKKPLAAGLDHCREHERNCCGHEEDLEPTVAAVVLGAVMIERHVTLSHEMWGTDQKASLEVPAMGMLAGRVRTLREMMGTGEKTLSEKELEVRKKLRG